MKTKYLSTSLVVIFALTSFNIYADGKKSYFLNKATVPSLSELKEIINFDKDLEIERWMVSLNDFNTNEFSSEESLQFENWMVSLNEFNATEFSFEESLQFESWMISAFTIENDLFNCREQELVLESWMMVPFEIISDHAYMDKELAFESWMFKF